MTLPITTLRGITWEHPRGYDCQVAAAAEYERRTGVRVEWEFRSLQLFADAPLEDLTARYDLLVIDHPHVPLAAKAGLLAALDGAGHDEELAALAADSVGPSHATYAHAGHQYGLATDTASQVAVHRPDRLPDAPTTWDQVLELADEGRVIWPAKPIDAWSSLCTIAANRGTPVGASPGVFLSAEDAAPVLDLLHRLADRVPAWCLSANPIQVAEALAAESDEVWAYAPLLYGYSNYSRAAFRPQRLRYVDMRPACAGSRAPSSAAPGLRYQAVPPIWPRRARTRCGSPRRRSSRASTTTPAASPATGRHGTTTGSTRTRSTSSAGPAGRSRSRGCARAPPDSSSSRTRSRPGSPRRCGAT